jgi:hypothetical protein
VPAEALPFGGRDASAEEAAQLPERYVRTAAYMALRVCEMFGMHPRRFDAEDEGWKRLMLAYVRVRLREEE